MSSVTIEPNSFEVLGDSSEVKFSTDNRYPIVMAEKSVYPYLYIDIPIYQNASCCAGYSIQTTNSFEYVYLTKGVDYEETPDFVIGVLDAQTTSTSYTATITGSYPVHIIPSAIYNALDTEIGIGMAMMVHLFVDASGNVRYRGEITAGNMYTSGYTAHEVYQATEALKAELQYVYSSGDFHYYRFRFDAEPLKIYAGKFIG